MLTSLEKKFLQHCQMGDVQHVIDYLSKGNNVDVIDIKQNNDLLYVIRHNHLKIFDLLIEHKINLNFCDSDGYNALFYACLYERFEILEKLLNTQIDLNHKNRNDENIISYILDNEWHTTYSFYKDFIKKLIMKNVKIKRTELQGLDHDFKDELFNLIEKRNVLSKLNLV